MNMVLVLVSAYCLGGKLGLGVGCLLLLALDLYVHVTK